MSPVLASLLSAALLAVLGLGPQPGPAAVWPLSPHPEVVAGFDPPAAEWSAGHRGVDLLGASGQTVRAARAGTVTFAGRIAGRGVVVVDHGTTRTTYEPVEATVRVGDRVRADDPIGRLGRFGSHCWPRSCLHWGLLEGETYLDPLSLVTAGPVRLQPLFTPLPDPARRSAVPSLGSAPAGARSAPLRFVRPAGAPAGRPDAAGPW
jgi:murein DD-endopeptidase MepM/ murein hydrolase activator NlpD